MSKDAPLISITQAEMHIRDALSALPAVRVTLAQAAGRVLRQAVAAALESRGYLTTVCYPAVDDRDKVATQIKTVLAENDCLILCGAV